MEGSPGDMKRSVPLLAAIVYLLIYFIIRPIMRPHSYETKEIQGFLYHLYLLCLVITILYPSFALSGKAFISASWNAVDPSHLQIQPTAD